MGKDRREKKEFEASYTIVDHTADWAIRISAPDTAQLLMTAAAGMNSLLVDNPDALTAGISKKLEVRAQDLESLLVEWLNELLYWAEMDGLLFHKFEIHSVSETHINATCKGSRPDALLKHIKAVTYHDLKIERLDSGLGATVVFDV